METHRTTKLGSFGHREITLQLAGSSPIPNLQRMLLGYLEGAVARGTRFLPGQTIQIGWAKLRLCERADGTIGVEERELTPDVRWTESVDRALRDTWLQREVNGSLGLMEQLTFPSQDQSLMVSSCAMDSDETVLTRLSGDDLPDDFSGWSLSCTEDHEHGEPSILPLLALAAHKPGHVQLLALPRDTTVLVLYRAKPDAPEGARRIEPHVFRDGKELVPAPGSYLAMLQGS